MLRKLVSAPIRQGAFRFVDQENRLFHNCCPPRPPRPPKQTKQPCPVPKHNKSLCPPPCVCRCEKPCPPRSLCPHVARTPYCKTVEPEVTKKKDVYDIPPNPCCPVYHRGHPSRLRTIFLLIFLPILIAQIVRAMNAEPPRRGDCRDYEYMRRRTKRFPWGDGQKTFFHNDHVNILPGECEDVPISDCDE